MSVPQASPAAGPALETSGIGVAYGGVRATQDVSLSVAPGEILGLIGPNGAGKTTLVDAWCGFVAHEGTVRVGGRDVTGWPPHRRARAGLVRTWQSVELIDDLTVAQNCSVGASGGDVGRRVAAALERVGVDDHADAMPSEISLGHRKLVGVARAVVEEPSVLLLDEPAAGLDPEETEALAGAVRALAADGLGVVLIEHDTRLVFSLCSRVVVLVGGQVLTDGPAEQVRADPRVLAAYLGTAT
ncbi:MAG: ATP-binding cassette domain-containing protein [Microthrixaceae bacterium]